MLHVGEVKASELTDYGVVIFGAPTQQAGPSPATKEMLNNIPARALTGTYVAAFDTRMIALWARIMGFAAPKIARNLKKKGGKLVIAAEGFYVTGGEGPLKEGEVERAAAWAKEIVGRID